MLKININSLGPDPEIWHGKIKSEDLDVDTGYQLKTPAEIKLIMQRLGQKVCFSVQAKAKIGLVCSRCLADYSADIGIDFKLVALPKEDFEPLQRRQDQSMAEAGEPGLMAYSGEYVDLMPEVRGALLLATPMKPLCRSDCRGLCPNCGSDLNHQACDCKP